MDDKTHEFKVFHKVPVMWHWRGIHIMFVWRAMS